MFSSILFVLAQASCGDGKQAVHFPSSIRDNCSYKSPSNEEIVQCNIAARDISEEQNVSAQTEGRLFLAYLIIVIIGLI